MPTYRNNTATTITVTDPMGGSVTFTPNQTKTSMFVLSDARLTQTLATPLYNPMVADVFGSILVGGTSLYTPQLTSRYIRIIPIEGYPTVFINSLDNIPGLSILEATTIINKGKITALYITNAGSTTASFNLKELW